MLAPVAEAEFGERALLELGLRSARALRRPSPPSSPRRRGQRRRLRAHAARSSSRATATRPRRSSASSRPARALGLRGRAAAARAQARRAGAGARADRPRSRSTSPGDHSVDPRRLVRARCARAGRSAPARVLRRRGASTVADARRRRGAAPSTVVRRRRRRGRGARSATTRAPVRPVKGQVAAPARPARARASSSASIRGASSGYLVPRGDGRYVLGATMEERGFDTAPTAGGVYELLRDAAELVPGVLELEIEELARRPAPGTPDNAAGDRPRRARRRSCWATGHYRNGILLAPRHRRRSSPARSPATALPEWAAACRPARASRRCPHERRRQRRADASSPPARPSRPLLDALDAARRRPRRRGRGRRRGRPARRSGPTHELRRGRAGRGPARDPGRLSVSVDQIPITDTPFDDRRARAALAAAPRHRRLPLARDAGRGDRGHAAPSSSPSRCAASTRRRAARSSTCSTTRGVAAAAQHRRLLHRARRGAHRASSPARRSRPTGSSSR